MKYILFALCVIWLSFSSASWAKTIYVTDSLQITMRILPDNNAKIIRMLPAAEASVDRKSVV